VHRKGLNMNMRMGVDQLVDLSSPRIRQADGEVVGRLVGQVGDGREGGGVDHYPVIGRSACNRTQECP
jgi:hypothetical protein